MKLGVATLWSYDQLDKLLRSAERGTEPPTGYVIVDNGGFYETSRAEAIVGRRRGVTVECVTPGSNLGVAASWNRILDLAGDGPIVISNDDMSWLNVRSPRWPPHFGTRRSFLGWAGRCLVKARSAPVWLVLTTRTSGRRTTRTSITTSGSGTRVLRQCVRCRLR